MIQGYLLFYHLIVLDESNNKTGTKLDLLSTNIHTSITLFDQLTDIRHEKLLSYHWYGSSTKDFESNGEGTGKYLGNGHMKELLEIGKCSASIGT